MATIIVGGIVGIVIIAVAVKVILDKINGKSSCSGNCAGCSGCGGHHDK